MLFQIVNNENGTIYNYEFDSLNELASYIETTPVNKKSFYKLTSEESDDNNSFFGTNNFSEAFTLCKYGVDPSKITEFLKFNEELEAKLPYLTKDRSRVENVYGIRPNIQKFLRGNPKSMYSLKRFTPRGIIDVYYNVSIKATASHDLILKRGVCSIQLVKLLEKLGYIVSFNLVSLSRVNDEYIYANIKIKNDNEYIDTVTSYFPMCHPSFPRRIMFRLKEVTPYKKVYQNYGVVVSLDSFLERNEDSKKIIIPDTDDFSKVSGNIDEYFLKLCETVNINQFLNEQEELAYDNKQKKLYIRSI